MEGSENWGPLEGQGCEESYKMGMVGELNILYTIRFFPGLPWRVLALEDRESLITVLSFWIVGLNSG